MQSLRQRQIDEIRNQDLNINKQVVAALNKQVATFNETVAAPTTDQAVNTDKLLNLIDKFNEIMFEAVNEVQRVHLFFDNTGIDLQLFNTIMRLRSFIIKNNYNSKNLINQQMQTMIPPINSFIIGFDNAIEEFVKSDAFNEGEIKYKVNLARFYSILAMAEAARSSLVTGSYRSIDLGDVDTTFNKIVQNLPANVKNSVLLGLTKSPLSGFNRGNGEAYEEAKKRLEAELRRPLTKGDDLMLAIRMGNFTQFKPILSNTQISMLDTNPNIDISDVPIPPEGFVQRPGPVFPEGFIPQAVPHTALQNEQNEDRDPTNLETYSGHGSKHLVKENTNNIDLNYRDDRNEDPYEKMAGKGKSILSRFA